MPKYFASPIMHRLYQRFDLLYGTERAPRLVERLAMLIHNLKSISEIYFASMPWLREAPLCRA